jgi:transcription elongation factor Elf1
MKVVLQAGGCGAMDMKKARINVVELRRFAVQQPIQTIRTFNNDFSTDTFTCPCCEHEVVITHWKDERGVWPDVDLTCANCGRHWEILMR